MTDALAPLHVFRFEVRFHEVLIDSDEPLWEVALCQGAFAECTGLEATMEPRVIPAGGHNHGAFHRAGPVTYATVILKRGITKNRDLWTWWNLVSGGKYAYRLKATITLHDTGMTPGTAAPESERGQPVWSWVLHNCLPVRMKAPDLVATSGEVGIEELHLVHEGLELLDARGGGA